MSSPLRAILFARGLKLLSSRPHSQHEMITKLARAAVRAVAPKRGRFKSGDAADARDPTLAFRSPAGSEVDPKAIAAEVINDLNDASVLNDVEFAKWFCKTRQGSPHGSLCSWRLL